MFLSKQSLNSFNKSTNSCLYLGSNLAFIYIGLGPSPGPMSISFNSLADELEEIDIGSGDRPRLMYVSAKLDPEYKQELVDLLKEFKDYFA